MAKLSLSPMTSGFLTATLIDANSDSIESEFQRKVLYRDNPTGEPNEMNNDIDMNGYNLLNLGNISIMASASLSQAIIWGTEITTVTQTLTTSYAFRFTEVSASTTVTLLLGTVAGESWIAGTHMSFVQKGTGQIMPQARVGVTLNYPKTARSNKQYSTIRLLYRGSDVWYLDGDLSAS